MYLSKFIISHSFKSKFHFFCQHSKFEKKGNIPNIFRYLYSFMNEVHFCVLIEIYVKPIFCVFYISALGTNLKVADRPMSRQGLGGVKTAAGMKLFFMRVCI